MAKKTALYMGSTEITAQQTAGEITAILVRAGARKITTEYGEGHKIVGLKFLLRVTLPSGELNVPFALPVRIEPVFQRIWNERGNKGHLPESELAKAEHRDREHAERVAWRQLLRWIQAQLAMIDTGMVEAAEVFMPYQ